MEIDRDYLTTLLADMEDQQRSHLANAEAAGGAAQLVKHLLARLDEEPEEKEDE